jgi:excisionase family DNA binding protein
MSIESTIAAATAEAVERTVRELAPAIAAEVVKLLGAQGPSELTSIEDAASELGIGGATVRKLVKDRRVRVYRTPGGAKRGGKMRVDVAEVKRAMAPAGAPVHEKDIQQQATALARKLTGNG